MLSCEFCDRTFKNQRSLASHKYSFHYQMPPKSTIAFVNKAEIAAEQNQKSDDSSDNSGTDQQTTFERKKSLLDTTTGNSSDESSDSDISVDSDGDPNPFRLKGNKSSKRKHKSDSSDEEQPAKLPKLEPRKKRCTKRGKDPRFNSNNKRVYVSDTDDEELEKKRYRRSDREPSTHPTRFRDRLLALKKINRNLNKKLDNLSGEYKRLQGTLQKELEQKELLTKQLGQVKKGDFDGITAVEKALMNSVTIAQINDIRKLVKLGYIERILEDEDKLLVIQRIMTGMLEGVIPISNPQEMAFTSKQRKFMHLLERVGVGEVKETITENIQEFYEVFEILDISLKMITKAFNQYGEN